jgi:hypothetical protein
MRSSTKSRQDEYIARLNALYSDAEKWIEDTDLKASRGQLELREEIPGSYDAPTLSIHDSQGSKVADLLPIGAWIIGAEGRVDLVGILDRNSLVFLGVGGPRRKTRVSVEGSGEAEEWSRPLFRGVDQPGWYWIEDKRLGRARLVTKQVFLDLLAEVSDHVL